MQTLNITNQLLDIVDIYMIYYGWFNVYREVNRMRNFLSMLIYNIGKKNKENKNSICSSQMTCTIDKDSDYNNGKFNQFINIECFWIV